MGLLNILFGSERKRTADETFLKDMVIEENQYEGIKKFRDITAENDIKLSLTDKEIIYVSQSVFKYFLQVAANRGEELKSHILFSIAESFLYKYQMTGNKFYLRHLQYELDKYGREGLRKDYIVNSQKWAY